MTAQLLRLEARRSAGVWLVLTLPLALWFMLIQGVSKVAPLWFETSLLVRDSALLLVPLLAGVAAWGAGREQRRGTAELLATMPYPHTARFLVAWLGTTVWGVLGYLLLGATTMSASWLRATWGGPFLGPMLVGLAALPTGAALGFTIGSYLPNRLTTPLVAVATFFGQFVVGWQSSWYAFLSPAVSLSGSIWTGVQPDLAPQQAAFLLSLGGLALGLLALRIEPSRPARIACVVLLLATVGSTILIWHAAPRGGGRRLFLDPRFQLQTIPYLPVCREAAVPVCVHPAYQPYLADTTVVINRLLAPVLGLPGMPTRAEQSAWSRPDDAILWFDLFPRSEYRNLAALVADRLVRDTTSYADTLAANCPAANPRSCSLAQFAIGRWLLRQADMPDKDTFFTTSGVDPTQDATARFAALDPAQQRAWLAAHLADLRAGRVSLEDLP